MSSRTNRRYVALASAMLWTLAAIPQLASALNSDTDSQSDSQAHTKIQQDVSTAPVADGLSESIAPVQTATPTKSALLDINFNISSGSFTYSDDTFRNTAQPAYASGKYITGNQCNYSGCLKTSLGGRNDLDINGMSGGWTSNFNVPQTATITLTLRYRIRQLRDYERNEYTEALVSLNGSLIGLGGNDYLRRIRGDGNGGSNIDTGWRTATLNLGRLSAGTHTLTVGGHNNRKTAHKEFSNVWFDNISMSSSANSEEIGDEVRFGVLGDFGVDNEAQAGVTREMNRWNLDFIITVGDNRYGNRSMDQVIGQYYCNFLADVNGGPYCPNGTSNTNAFFPSPGNHDYGDGGGIDEYLDYFNLPGSDVVTTGTSGTELYYDFIQGPVHFFAIDSDGPRQALQQAWLQRGLEASSSPWKVVFFHHPPYSSSSYHGSNRRMQWDFAAWGADVVIGGHDHTFERLERDGVLYFVNGMGGRKFYDLGTPLTGSRIQYNSDHGAQRIVASPSQMRLEFVTQTGEVIDARTIRR